MDKNRKPQDVSKKVGSLEEKGQGSEQRINTLLGVRDAHKYTGSSISTAMSNPGVKKGRSPNFYHFSLHDIPPSTTGEKAIPWGKSNVFAGKNRRQQFKD